MTIHGRLLLAWSISAGVVGVCSGRALALPPANDNFADAAVITGPEGSLGGNTADTTRENGEPEHLGSPCPTSSWYAWTAPGTGTWTFRQDPAVNFGSFTHGFAIYTGDAVNQLTRVRRRRRISWRIEEGAGHFATARIV